MYYPMLVKFQYT